MEIPWNPTKNPRDFFEEIPSASLSQVGQTRHVQAGQVRLPAPIWDFVKNWGTQLIP